MQVLLNFYFVALLGALPNGNDGCNAAFFKAGQSALMQTAKSVGSSGAKVIVSKGATRIAAYSAGGAMMGAGDVIGDVVKAKIDGENNLNIIRALQTKPQQQQTVRIEKIVDVTDQQLPSKVLPPGAPNEMFPYPQQMIQPYNPISILLLKHLADLKNEMSNRTKSEQASSVGVATEQQATSYMYVLITFGVAGACALFLVIILSFFLCLRRQYSKDTDRSDYSVKFIHEPA